MLYKRIIAVFLLLPIFSVFCYAAPSVSARSAVLLLPETGEVLFEKNAREKRSMASTTKIMTALLAIEQAQPNREIVVTPEMLRVEGTSMGLLAGDRVTLQGLACGMLLESGNDAANATAFAMDGSIEKFAARMNARAKQIGMVDTNFVTPSGLDAKEHYSTAYDMALLGANAIANPAFLKICSAKSMRVLFGNPPYLRILQNHNRLLSLYDGAVGIKTGFTKKSGRCLVSAAKRNGVTLVAVTLCAPDDWNDHKQLYDYGFSRVKTYDLPQEELSFSIKVYGGSQKCVQVTPASKPQYHGMAKKNSYCEIYVAPFLYAPIYKGQSVGIIRYKSEDNRVLFETVLRTSEAVEYKASQKKSWKFFK